MKAIDRMAPRDCCHISPHDMTRRVVHADKVQKHKRPEFRDPARVSSAAGRAYRARDNAARDAVMAGSKERIAKLIRESIQ